jgi:HSP20 family protein
VASLMTAPVEPKNAAARRPFDVSRYMAQEMDRLFNDFGVRTYWPFASATRSDVAWVPALEVDEKDGVFRVRVDLPGMRKEDVKVDIAEGMLTIEGERKHDEQPRDGSSSG